MAPSAALFRFRVLMLVFIVGLILSGVTAFPLLWELKILVRWLGLEGAVSPAGQTGLAFWILTIRFGLEDMYRTYPWVAYGTDWLAFGHLVIAMFFVHPLVRPRESRPALCTGLAACVLVWPLALVAGSMRGIPLYWRLVDCAFGVLGVIPLLYCWRLLRVMESAPSKDDSNGR